MGPRLGAWLLLGLAALLLHEESSRAAAKVSPGRLRCRRPAPRPGAPRGPFVPGRSRPPGPGVARARAAAAGSTLPAGPRRGPPRAAMARALGSRLCCGLGRGESGDSSGGEREAGAWCTPRGVRVAGSPRDLNSHLGLAWPPGALTCAGRPRGPGREGWTRAPRPVRSPTHVPGRRSGRVSLELWRLWWLMLNSPGPFAWKQLSSRFPTTLLSPKHAKEQRRAFLSSSFQTLPNSTL